MEEKYIATIMKKHALGNGEAIYTIIDTLVGTLNKENNTFIDSEGNVYRHLCDRTEAARKLTSKEYYNLTPISEIQQYYPEYTEEDLIETFNQTRKSTIYYYGQYDETHPMIMAIDTDNIKDMFRNAKNQPQRLQEQTEEEEVAELIARISTGCFTPEELTDIKNQSANSIAMLTQVIENVDEFLESQGLEAVLEDDSEIDINKVYENVVKTLIDQDAPARRLIVEIARNLDEENKEGILITGNSGSGKTLLMELLSKYLNRPFLLIDSTQLTGPAHTGKNIEQCLWELYEKCNFDQEAAEHAIVYFDEIDKKGSERKSDIAGQGVLNLLLKFLDGATYIACKNPQEVREGTYIPISTKNMTIIAGGAFSEIYDTKKKNPLGFNAENSQEEQEPQIEDFIKKALMPKEFMGRFPVIIHLNTLSESSLKKIMTSSDGSPIKKQQEKFASKGVEFKVTEEYLDAVAKRAHERKIGARGLSKIIKDTTWKPYDIVSCNKGEYEQVILDADVVEDINKFQLIKRRTTI